MAGIPYWVIRNSEVYPPAYYRVVGDSTSNPKLALRFFELEGAVQMARALGDHWVETVVFFDSKSSAMP
jgi:hypothetical protein